jgi:hypothetical protein
MNNILDSIFGVINYPVAINVAPMYSKAYAANNTVPFWLLVASFAILFSVVWIASSYINIFKDKKNKGPRAMFAIAVSFISLFGTPLAIWIMKVVYTFTLLTIIAVLILGTYIIWTLTRSGWAESAKTNAESTKTLADAKTKNAESERQNAQTKEYREKTKLAARNGLKSQLSEIRRIKSGLKNLISDFYNVKKKKHYPVNNNTMMRFAKQVSSLNTYFENLGKLISFTVPNDRIMSLMSNVSYDTTNTTGLSRINPIAGTQTGTASLAADVETQTNDFGHSLSAIKDTIQNGITNELTINNLINWTESAVNIATRMERDIVLEKQMIEKLE